MKAIGLKIAFRQGDMITTRQENFDKSVEEIVKDIFNRVYFKHWNINKMQIIEAYIIFDNLGSYYKSYLDCSVLNGAIKSK